LGPLLKGDFTAELAVAPNADRVTRWGHDKNQVAARFSPEAEYLSTIMLIKNVNLI